MIAGVCRNQTVFAAMDFPLRHKNLPIRAEKKSDALRLFILPAGILRIAVQLKSTPLSKLNWLRPKTKKQPEGC
jgi:hypothetical protein